jgi:uncharacterized membrane protein
MAIETVLALVGGALMGSKRKEAVQGVFKAFRERSLIARDVGYEFDSEATFGKWLADRVAEIGGSWGFVVGFFVFLIVWTGLNTVVLTGTWRLDPYPFIFLNLLLSMLAAIQAPIIMMSQNRQSAKDRLEARHDFEVNLKAELEILALHEKLDRLHVEHSAQLSALLELLRAGSVKQDILAP